MLAGLRRITRDGQWIPEIDSLRFIAIFSVFLFHLHMEILLRSGGVAVLQPGYGWLFEGLRNGYRGVPLFFVISGFILGLPFARQWLVQGRKVALGKYFLRRLTRLEPPYIASYLVAMLMYGVFSRGTGITRTYWEHVIAGIFYVNSLIFHSYNAANPVAWSLEIEIQFYILAPLLALIFAVRKAVLRRWLMVILIGACGAAQVAFMQNSVLAQKSIAYYLQYFLAGFLLADVYLLGSKERSALWDATAMVGWIVYFFTPKSGWTQALFPYLLILLCAAALRSRLLRFFFSNGTIAVIGGMCYSIYLLHFLLIAAFFKFTRRLIVPQDYLVTFAIQVLVVAVPVLLLCALYYVWVERPCMDPNWPAKLKRRFAGGNTAVETLAEPKSSEAI